MSLYADYVCKNSSLYDHDDEAIENRIKFIKELINLILFNNTIIKLNLKRVFDELSLAEKNDLINALGKNHQLESVELTDNLTSKQQKIFDMRFNKAKFFNFPSQIDVNKEGKVLEEEKHSKLRFNYLN